MTVILNFFAHIGSYAGVGMVMLVLGTALIALAVMKLSGLKKAERSMTVAEFNRQFIQDTGTEISDAEAGAKRKDIARDLGIRKQER